MLIWFSEVREPTLGAQGYLWGLIAGFLGLLHMIVTGELARINRLSELEVNQFVNNFRNPSKFDSHPDNGEREIHLCEGMLQIIHHLLLFILLEGLLSSVKVVVEQISHYREVASFKIAFEDVRGCQSDLDISDIYATDELLSRMKIDKLKPIGRSEELWGRFREHATSEDSLDRYPSASQEMSHSWNTSVLQGLQQLDHQTWDTSALDNFTPITVPIDFDHEGNKIEPWKKKHALTSLPEWLKASDSEQKQLWTKMRRMNLMNPTRLLRAKTIMDLRLKVYFSIFTST